MSTASKDTSSVALLDKLTPLFSLDEDVIPSKMIYLNIPSALSYTLLLYVSAKSAYDHILEPFRRSETVLPTKNVVRVDVLSATNTLLTLPSFAPPSELLAREEHAFPQTVNCLLVANIPPRSGLLGNSTRWRALAGSPGRDLPLVICPTWTACIATVEPVLKSGVIQTRPGGFREERFLDAVSRTPSTKVAVTNPSGGMPLPTKFPKLYPDGN